MRALTTLSRSTKPKFQPPELSLYRCTHLNAGRLWILAAHISQARYLFKEYTADYPGGSELTGQYGKVNRKFITAAGINAAEMYDYMPPYQVLTEYEAISLCKEEHYF